MIPFRTPFFLPAIYPSLLWRMPSDEKVLYLTFDDGPIAGPTEFVLETLANLSAKATFFCIGDNVRKHYPIFERVVKEGHAIGNHTFNHLNGWKTDNGRYIDNIQACDQVMKLPNAQSTKLFRPPYGKIRFSQIKLLSAKQIVMWDVLTHDYNHRMSADHILKKSIRATRNGSIIVLHDSLKASRNMMHVLPRFIEHFAAQGYAFKSLPA